MNFADFYKLAEATGEVEYPEPNLSTRRGLSTDEYLKLKNSLSIPEKGFFEITWRTGGISGGSCWDEGDRDPHYHVSGDIEPRFTTLDAFLLKVCPNLSFIIYKKIDDLFEIREYSEYEYYGNSTNYVSKSINIKGLYDILVEYNQL